MRCPRPTEGRVNRSYESDDTSSYGHLGYPDVTPSYNNSYSHHEIIKEAAGIGAHQWKGVFFHQWKGVFLLCGGYELASAFPLL